MLLRSEEPFEIGSRHFRRVGAPDHQTNNLEIARIGVNVRLVGGAKFARVFNEQGQTRREIVFGGIATRAPAEAPCQPCVSFRLMFALARFCYNDSTARCRRRSSPSHPVFR